MGIALKLLGIGKAVIGWVVAFFAWLFEDWRRVVIAATLALIAALVWHIRALNADLDDHDAMIAAEVKRADTAELMFEAMKAQHADFVAKVQRRTEDAERRDRENAARVAREMEIVKERTADEYEDRLADTRLALSRLRDRIAPASAGSEGDGGPADLSDPYASRCEAFGFPSCDALLAALPDLLAAAEDNTGKLIALQAWARGVLAIDLNGIDDPPPD